MPEGYRQRPVIGLIERVDVRRRSLREDVNDVFGLGWQRRHFRRQRRNFPRVRTLGNSLSQHCQVEGRQPMPKR